MLDQAWLIPTIPAVSFFAILFFGKRLPRKGSEIGILAVGTSFVLACITAVEWINRIDDSTTEKVKPVIQKYSAQVGEDTVREVFAEISKVRK